MKKKSNNSRREREEKLPKFKLRVGGDGNWCYGKSALKIFKP